MSSSFYQKEGLDYLYFARPGTAYNNPAAFGQTSKAMGMMGTQTRSQFFSGAQPGGIRPIEMISSKSQSSKSLIQ